MGDTSNAPVPVVPARRGKKLLFAVAVVLLFMAAIVAANLRTRDADNYEPSAAAGVRTLMIYEPQYKSTYGHYALDLKVLGGTAEQCQKPTSANACLVDETLANSSPAQPRHRYYYSVSAGPSADSFVVWGIPLNLHNRVFCATDDGMVRFSAHDAGASSTSYTACKALPAIGD